VNEWLAEITRPYKHIIQYSVLVRRKLLYSKNIMAWLIIILVVGVLGYYGLKAMVANDDRKRAVWRANDDRKRAVWREDLLNGFKNRIYEHHNKTIAKYSNGEQLIGMTKKETAEKIIEWRTEIEKIRLWDKHIKTIQARDTYSQDSKIQLENAWFDYLAAYSNMVQPKYVGDGDPWEEMKNIFDLMDTFLAKLEAFGYDGEKEQNEIQHKLASQHKKVKHAN